MEIFLEGLGKRYQRDWIFQGLDFAGKGPQTVALLGANGAGKSTLLRIAAGLAVPSAGRVGIRSGAKEWLDEEHTAYCSFTAPYLELPEELPFKDLLRFHFRFRPLLSDVSLGDLPEILQLQAYANRSVQQFSSGMKQRVRLGLALFTGVPFLFLDEPLTNLDSRGETWYHDLVAGYRRGRFLMVASNRPEEYTFCERTMMVTDYKP